MKRMDRWIGFGRFVLVGIALSISCLLGGRMEHAQAKLHSTTVLPPMSGALPHLDLEMTGSEYRHLLALRPDLLSQSDAEALEPVLELGVRNLKWLEFINSHRDEAHRISFSSKATQVAFPIDQPKEY